MPADPSFGSALAPGASFDLTGRIALVTGASRGLGAATARRLAELGCDIAITYRRDAQGAEATADAIRGSGTRVWIHQIDLADSDAIDALLDEVGTQAGGLDLLVANAAQTKFCDLIDAEPRHVERTFAISVGGFLRLVQRSVPLMEARGAGRIVAISGADTQTYIPAHGLLGAAKSAMETMVKYLACELGRRNITTVAVCPGFIAGDSIRQMLGPFYDAAVISESKSHPMGVATTPEHIAEAVVLACTDAARFLNGDTIMADGAGVFSFCGRYINAAARLDLAAGMVEPGGDAPSVQL